MILKKRTALPCSKPKRIERYSVRNPQFTVINHCLFFIRKFWPVLIVFALGLTPLLWFKPGFIVARGDYFPFVNPLANSRFMYTWSDATALGSVPQAGNPTPMQSIWFALWYIFYSVGLGIGSIQIILQVTYFIGAGLSMYLLASTVYKQGKFTPFVASIFYMFNLVMFFRNFNDAASWFLVLIPLMIFFYIRIIRNVRQGLRITRNVIAFSAISTVLLSFSLINPAYTVLTVAVFFVLFLYSLITEKGLRLKIFRALCFLSSVTLLMNIWWIIPLIIEITSYAGGSIQLGTTTNVVGWSFVYGRSSFLNLFWLNGIWNWTPEYFPFIGTYANPILQTLLFIPMVLAFSALFFKGKYRKINLSFATTIVVLIFLAKGLHPPLGEINLFVYNHLPGAFLFREPFLKLYDFLLIPMALLIGFATTSVVQKIKISNLPYKKILCLLLVLFLVSSFIISVFPLFKTDLLFGKTEALPFSSYVQIPTYWYQASDYINSISGNFRVLQTPGDDFYQIPYIWGYYGSDAIASSLITKPVLQNSFGYASVNDMASLIYQEIDANESLAFVNTISLLNIKYIIQRNDVWWNYSGRTIHSPEYMKSFLSNTSGIKFVTSFGPLDIFKVSDDLSLPRVYTTNSQVFTDNSISYYTQILSDNNTSIHSAFFFSDQLSASQDQFIESLPNTLVNNKTEINSMPANGRKLSFAWDDLIPGSLQIRYYSGWKNVIRTDGDETQDTLSFPSLDSCPYEFSSAYNGTGWAAHNSTLVYLKTGNEPIAIGEMLGGGQPIPDIMGVWWQTGWEGMGTKPLQLPIIIPANQEVIIQFNHILTENITIASNPIPLKTFSPSDNKLFEQNLPQLEFSVINPTKVEVTIRNATQPFFLTFGENYDPQWKAYITNNSQVMSQNGFTVQDISYLFNQPINSEYHFIDNGYANVWYIDPLQLHEGTNFTITLFFVPQAYYYIGELVTILTILIAVCYLLLILVRKKSDEMLILHRKV